MKLEEHPFIQNFPGDFGKTLVRHVTPCYLKEGEILFDEGEPATSLFLVLSGNMVLEKKYQGEEFFTLAQTRAGEYFGELAVLDGSTRSARARCLQEANLAEVRAKTLFSVLERAPSSSVIRFFLPLASNLRSTSSRFIREMLSKEKLAAVGEMADSIMHDLRSPLTTIQLACDLLRREVADGPGVPEEIQERIFEPFVTHGKEKGTGIGLAIVKTMVEAHGGTISFSSEAGKGTEFRLLLPMSSCKTVGRETG